MTDTNDRFLLPLGDSKRSFVSRAGHKLQAAITTLDIPIAGLVAADLGSNVGGFVDCLLQAGAARVYAVETGYGVLAWTLRKNPLVVVRERTNAMHVQLPEAVDLVSIDVAWTPQEKILPAALRLLKPGGSILTLIKPHYESQDARRSKGLLTEAQAVEVLHRLLDEFEARGIRVRGVVKSPLEGEKRGNIEFVAWLQKPE